jgi:hypothetical protein
VNEGVAPSYSARAAVRANQCNVKNINAMVMPISFPTFLRCDRLTQLGPFRIRAIARNKAANDADIEAARRSIKGEGRLVR